MKHERFFTGLTAACLALAAAMGTIGCIATAFSLELQEPHHLLVLCSVGAALAAAGFSFRHGEAALLAAGLLTLEALRREGSAPLQFRQLIHHISTFYDSAYGWGIPPLPEDVPPSANTPIPLGILGIFLILCITRYVCQRKSLLPVLLACLVPLSSCIVVTDTVPEPIWLLTVLAPLLLLLLTASVRKDSNLQSLRLTAMAALPVVLGLLLIFHCIPQDSYVNQSEALRKTILDNVRRLPQLVETGLDTLLSPLPGESARQVDLQTLGPREPNPYPVMDILSDQGGTIYLRQQDFDRYDGFGWSSDPDRTEVFSRQGSTSDTLTIRTRNLRSHLLLPYYPTDAYTLTGGLLKNHLGSDYTIPCTPLPSDWRQVAYTGADTAGSMPEGFLSLPESTRTGAKTFLDGLFSGDAGNTEKAECIAALVLNTAKYDQNTAPMPEGQTDFALWFLREGDRGYCVHFATAATVLLRAAEVPARYVTGYMIDAPAGRSVTVTEENAHAWAEYYEPRLDAWVPLEATPVPEDGTQSAPLPVPGIQTAPTQSPEEPSVPATEPPVPEDLTPAPELIPEEPAKGGFPLQYLLILPLAALILWLQRRIRLCLRRNRLHRGSTNLQALRRWQEAHRLSRLLEADPPETLLQLAQKARFSQHLLTPEELSEFDGYILSCQRQLKRKSRLRQLLYQYIYAVY